MFEKAIEQIKGWTTPPDETETDETGRGINIPAVILLLWGILILFTDSFGFDPLWTSSLPKVFALMILCYLAAKEYQK